MSKGLTDTKPKGLDRLRDQFYRSSLYRFWLSRIKTSQFHALGCTPLVGASIAKCEGDVLFHARQQIILDETLWAKPSVNNEFTLWLHSFSWLPLLNDHILAERMILSWIDHNEQWSPKIWKPDVLSFRIQHWGWFLNKTRENHHSDFYQKIIQSHVRQARHLLDRRLIQQKGINRILARSGQLYAHCLIYPDKPAAFLKKLNLLSSEMIKQITADGGHISRSPQSLLDILDVLGCVEQLCKLSQTPFPEHLKNIRERIHPLMKALLTPSDQLVVFQGSNQGNPKQFKQVFATKHLNCLAQNNALHSGYQRLEAGQTVAIMDCGHAVDKTINPKSSPSTFALEIWNGQECLITNCGQFVHGPQNWQDALNATKAHSCLVVDDKDMTIDNLSNENEIDVFRISEKSNILVEAQHKGYLKDFGLIHKRAFFMNQTGEDLRVEDQLIGSGGNRWQIHLHLHPDVHCQKFPDEDGVLLKLSSGQCWILKGAPCDIDIQESLYFGHDGLPCETNQIILSGPLRGEGCTVKWRLSKTG